MRGDGNPLGVFSRGDGLIVLWGEVAGDADHFGVLGFANHQHEMSGALVAHRLLMNFRDKWTGRVDGLQSAPTRFRSHLRWDAVRREDHWGAVGDFGERFDKDNPASFKCTHDVFIVHDGVAHVERRSKVL